MEEFGTTRHAADSADVVHGLMLKKRREDVQKTLEIEKRKKQHEENERAIRRKQIDDAKDDAAARLPDQTSPPRRD